MKARRIHGVESARNRPELWKQIRPLIWPWSQGQSRLFRFDLDAAGDLVGSPVPLATFPTNVANVQFREPSRLGHDADLRRRQPGRRLLHPGRRSGRAGALMGACGEFFSRFAALGYPGRVR